MYERMLDKKNTPKEKEINEYIGKKSLHHMKILENSLSRYFEISRELKFPFGNNYGWGYKVNHKSKHLLYIFFEKDSISIMLQIKKIITEKEKEKYSKLSKEGKKYWEESYPCGKNGGWIHYRILNEDQLKDIGIFLSVKNNKDIEI